MVHFRYWKLTQALTKTIGQSCILTPILGLAPVLGKIS